MEEKIKNRKINIVQLEDLGENVIDDKASQFDDEILENYDNERRQTAIDEALNSLTPRREMIVRHYLGIGVERKSQTELAKDFGVSHQAISWLFHDAIKRLKDMRVLDFLKSETFDKNSTNYLEANPEIRLDEEKNKRLAKRQTHKQAKKAEPEIRTDMPQKILNEADNKQHNKLLKEDSKEKELKFTETKRTKEKAGRLLAKAKLREEKRRCFKEEFKL